jgi:hypothetical protein
MEVMCSHAEQSKEALCCADGADRKNVETILDVCDGQPFALAVVGRVIGVVARKPGYTPSGAVRSFFNRLCLSSARLIENSGGKNTAQLSVLATSLDAASKHNHINLTSGFLSLEMMYTALCVMQSQGWAPVSMLRRLWGLEDVVDAREIAELFVNFGLATEKSWNGQK